MKSIKTNFIWNTVLKVSSIIFPLIIYPYVSRTVGVDGIGRVSFAISVITYFSIISQLGIPTYGVRTVAQCAKDRDALSKTTQEIFRINIVTMIISYLILIVAVRIVPRFQEDKLLLLIASLEMVFNAIGMVWLFSGLEQYSYITKRSIAFKAISLILIFVFVHKPEDYLSYAAITVFSVVGSNIINLVYSRKFINYKHYDNRDYKKHLKPILVFFLMSVANTVYTSLDTIMLGFLANNKAVGLYTSATKVRSVLLGVINALAIVMLPRSSYYIKQGLREEFVKISQKAFHFIVLISTATWIYFSFYAKECILLLSGYEFIDATRPMIWILPTILICGISNLTAIQMLVSLGKEKSVLFSQIVGAVIDFALNALFIPQFGPSAAAASTMIAEFVILIIQVVFLHREGIQLKRNLKIYKVFTAIIIAFLASAWVKFVINSIFLRLIFSSILFFGTYAITLFFLRDHVFIGALNDVTNMINGRLSRN